MDVSIVIVTKNRAEALAFTLEKIQKLMDCSKHEVLVFIDGCEATEFIKKDFAWVKWFGVSKSIGASPARNQLYKHATGGFVTNNTWASGALVGTNVNFQAAADSVCDNACSWYYSNTVDAGVCKCAGSTVNKAINV